jgi:hypothetical protein
MPAATRLELFSRGPICRCPITHPQRGDLHNDPGKFTRLPDSVFVAHWNRYVNILLLSGRAELTLAPLVRSTTRVIEVALNLRA